MTAGGGGVERPVLAAVATGDGCETAVITDGARFIELREFLAELPESLTSVVSAWSAWGTRILALLEDPATVVRLDSAGKQLDPDALVAPVTGGQTYCAIGNYRDQLLEAALDSAGDLDAERVRGAHEDTCRVRRATGAPYVAMTGAVRVAGPQHTLVLPEQLTTLDWEVEIAAVIGRAGWQLRPDQAMDVVAGFCVANDLTARSSVFRKDVPALGTDWLASKGQPGWLPMGPWLVPAAHLHNPNGLKLQLKLNGDTMQSGNSSDMLFSIAELIAHISHHTRLEPGDIVCTGSPAGFGSHYGRYLRPGDVLEASVEGLGVQSVTVVGPALAARTSL